MGNITVSLEEEDEHKLRRLAQEKYQGKKGSLAKVISEGLGRMEAESKREQALKKLFARMEKGYALGIKRIKHRSELYDRKIGPY